MCISPCAAVKKGWRDRTEKIMGRTGREAGKLQKN